MRQNTSNSKILPNIEPGHENAISTYAGLRQLSQTVNTAIRSLDKIVIAAGCCSQAAAARARAGGHVVEARRVGVDERVEGAEGRLARLQPQLVEQRPQILVILFLLLFSLLRP